MNLSVLSISPVFVEAIGWTLIHSLWQGALIALALTILMLLLRRNSAQLRYLLAFFSLLILTGWAAFTFSNAFRYANEKAELKALIEANPQYISTLLLDQNSDRATTTHTIDAKINFEWLKVRSFLQRHFHLVFLFWVLGMVILVLRMLGGMLYARRLRNHQLIPLGSDWIEVVNNYSERLGIQRKVKAFFSPLAKGPMTLGTFKPVILFPVAAFTGLAVKDIEAIIAHELAHVLRHDYFFNIIQSAVEILFFYHPAVWMISAQIKAERENSCDNIAIGLTGDKPAYIKALAKIQITTVEQERLAMAFASHKTSVLQRIKRLQKQVAMKTNFIEGLIAAGVLVIGLSLVSFTMGNKIHPQMVPVEVNQMSEPAPVKTWTAPAVDSVRHTLDENLEKAVEVAWSEEDDALSAEMMEEINKVLAELDIEGIVHEAMREASRALEEIDHEAIRKEIESEIDQEEIRREMREARREIEAARREIHEEMRREMENDNVPEEVIRLSVDAAEAGLKIAETVLENIPLEEIIETALTGVDIAFDALKEIDWDEVSIENDSLSEEDIERLKAQLEDKEKELKQAKEKLKQKEKELKNK
ncbi:M56 family metallopeptidase [Roseimarinus sediminis]|uniref:M56 family metallopeptidase n=1 Tax=Roseimarinus sediminis TaxID=1610899 RepID=UPI003D1D4BA3